jgi:hypothetical protein
MDDSPALLLLLKRAAKSRLLALSPVSAVWAPGLPLLT